MSSYFSQFGNSVASTDDSYKLYNLTALVPQITLFWPVQYQSSTNVVARIIDVTATAGGQSLVLPPATNVSVGKSILFTNKSAFTITIFKSDLVSLTPLASGASIYIYLTDSSTAGGAWNITLFGQGVSAVTSISAVSSNANITVAPTTITSAGTFTFSLALDLKSITEIAATGLAVRTAANTWNVRTLTGTAGQIAIANQDGVAGNPTFSLPPTITGINNLTVGNINITANTVSTTNANGDINFAPNLSGGGPKGRSIFDSNVRIITGQLLDFRNPANTFSTTFAAGNNTSDINYTLPTVAPTDGQALTANVAGILTWSNVTTFGGATTVHAIARFSNITGSLENSGIILDDQNNITSAVSIAVSNLNIAGIATPTTISTTAGNLILSPNGTSELYSTNNLSVRGGNLFKLFNTANNNFISLRSSATLPVTYDLTLPSAIPSLGQQLTISALGTTPAPNTFIWRDPIPGENILINGSFDIWQRNTSFTSATTFFPNNDLVVTADRWKLCSNGNNIVNVARAGSFNILSGATKYFLQATVQTANTKFGFAQILESYETHKLIGKPISFSIGLTGSGITTIKGAILSWQGAPDILTTPFVTAWNGAGVNPTLAANWTYEAVQTFTITNSFQLFTMNNVQISTSVTSNSAVFVWTDDASAIAGGSTLSLAAAKLEFGQINTPFNFRSVATDLALSKRWFQKDFLYSTPVGTPLTHSASSIRLSTQASPVNNGLYYVDIDFEVEMRVPPTVTTYPNTVVTNTSRWSDNGGGDLAANSAVASGTDTKSFLVLNNSGATISFSNGYVIGHWFADCEF